MNKIAKRTAITVAGLALVGGFIASPAGAAVRATGVTYPLAARAVAAKQVVDNSLPASKIVKADRDAFLKDTDNNGKLAASKDCAPVVIEKFGGSFKTGKTKVCELTLPAGTYRLDQNAFFARTIAGVAGTRPQLAARIGASDTEFGTDVGTIMGQEISPSKDRELAGFTSRVVVLTKATKIEWYAFGYNDDQGVAGSGQITAAANIAAYNAG